MFHQIHLVEEKGWSLSAWASLYLLYAIVSNLARLSAGPLIDKFGAIRIIPWMSLLAVVTLAVLASTNGLWAAGAFMVLLGLSIGIYATISSPFFAEMYGTRHLGSINSVATAAIIFSSAMTPVLIGKLIDAGVTMATMASVCVVFTLLASGLAAFAVRMKLGN